MISHLKAFPDIQCSGCLRTQLWEGEGEPGAYRMFILENHTPECPYESRRGKRVTYDQVLGRVNDDPWRKPDA